MDSILRKIPAGAWVFTFAFVLQFAILFSISGTDHFLPASDDMKFYNDWALRIASGQWSDGKAFYGMPGFAYILALIYTVTGYDQEFSPFLIGHLNAVFHALTATFVFFLGRRIFGEENRGTILSIVAVAVWLGVTSAQVFTAILMPTSWVVCGYWGTALFLMRTAQSNRPTPIRTWLFAGIIAGLIATTVATILMMLPLALLCIALTGARGEKRTICVIATLAGAFAMSSSFSAAFDFSGTRLATALTATAAAIAIAVCRPTFRHVVLSAFTLIAGVYIATSPVWIHNRLVAKDTVFLSAHDGLNLFVGNNAEANGYTKVPSTLSAAQERMLRDSEAIPQIESGRAMKRSEISAYWKAKAHAYMRENTGDWLKLLWVKFTNFWNAYQYDDLSILKLLRDEGAVPPGFRFGFIAALGLAGLPICWIRLPGSRWIIGAVVLHIASLMPVFITERYRLAAAPGLILIGVGGLAVLWDSVSQRKWTTAIACAIAFVTAAVFCTQSRADAGWALDFYKAGTRATHSATRAIANNNSALAAESLERAQRNLDSAYAHAPRNPEVVFAMGNFWMAKGDISRAEACYKRAFAQSVAINPARPHEASLTNLGMTASRREAWAEAEHYFSESLRIDASNTKAWFSLAEARARLGNRAAALEAVEQARALRPGHPEIEALYKSLKN